LVRSWHSINHAFIKHQVTYTGNRSIINPVKYYGYRWGIVIYVADTARNKIVEEYLVINGAGKAAIPVVKISTRQSATSSAVGIVRTTCSKGNIRSSGSSDTHLG